MAVALRLEVGYMKGNEVFSHVITVVYLGMGAVPVYMLSAFSTLIPGVLQELPS